jgi:hypothetical protein
MTDVAVSLFAMPSLETCLASSERSAAKYAVAVNSEPCCLSVSSMAESTTAFYRVLEPHLDHNSRGFHTCC